MDSKLIPDPIYFNTQNSSGDFLSQKEVADILGESRQYVRGVELRALKKCRLYLENLERHSPGGEG